MGVYSNSKNEDPDGVLLNVWLNEIQRNFDPHYYYFIYIRFHKNALNYIVQNSKILKHK